MLNNLGAITEARTMVVPMMGLMEAMTEAAAIIVALMLKITADAEDVVQMDVM